MSLGIPNQLGPDPYCHLLKTHGSQTSRTRTNQIFAHVLPTPASLPQATPRSSLSERTPSSASTDTACAEGRRWLHESVGTLGSLYQDLGVRVSHEDHSRGPLLAEPFMSGSTIRS